MNEYFYPLLGEYNFGNEKYSGVFLNNKLNGPGTANGRSGWYRQGELYKADKTVFIPAGKILQNVFELKDEGTEKTIHTGEGAHDNPQTFKGMFLDEAGNKAPENYSGNGIFWKDNRRFYIGRFANGVPDGTGGLLQFSEGHDRWANSVGIDNNICFGRFTKGIFADGLSASSSAIAGDCFPLRPF